MKIFYFEFWTPPLSNSGHNEYVDKFCKSMDLVEGTRGLKFKTASL